MGQLLSVCTDPSGEPKKPPAFSDSRDPVSTPDSLLEQHQSLENLAVDSTIQEEEQQDSQAERLRAVREEQARLELIVSTAGRDMMAVRSTRGSTGYYDQGFAAALAQHLEQTANKTTYNEHLPSISAKDQTQIVDILVTGEWEGIALGNKDGLAGCDGENPNAYMDHVAESLLASFVPAKEQMFAGVGPMVENLL